MREFTTCTVVLLVAAAVHGFALYPVRDLRRDSVLSKRSIPKLIAGRSEENKPYYADIQASEVSEGSAATKASNARLSEISWKFQQIGWGSWWAQVILSSVAGTIILFSNAITDRAVKGNVIGNGVFLAGVGVISAFASIFWTWQTILKAAAWVSSSSNKRSSPEQAQKGVRGALKTGVWINIIGMLIALLGAEQIVGTLLAKVISGGISSGQVVASNIPSSQQIRALDIFVLQANTNTLLSHFASLGISLHLLTRSRDITKSKV